MSAKCRSHALRLDSWRRASCAGSAGREPFARSKKRAGSDSCLAQRSGFMRSAYSEQGGSWPPSARGAGSCAGLSKTAVASCIPNAPRDSTVQGSWNMPAMGSWNSCLLDAWMSTCCCSCHLSDRELEAKVEELSKQSWRVRRPGKVSGSDTPGPLGRTPLWPGAATFRATGSCARGRVRWEGEPVRRSFRRRDVITPLSLCANSWSF
mmetsp:Transcript_51135/g.119245  ORF Transcript_51135/g.119245 Transcript_51135/m.119245 type:complete len:208 (-) Transcript_51135:498-1121(-)